MIEKFATFILGILFAVLIFVGFIYFGNGIVYNKESWNCERIIIEKKEITKIKDTV